MATLQDIVEELYIKSQQRDSILRNTTRYMINKYAKKGLKELNLTFTKNIKGMNFVVPPSCKVFKPADYETFIRAYLLDCDGERIEITRNTDMPSSIFHFLVNCDGSLLDDCEGGHITDECIECNAPMEDGDCSHCHSEECHCCSEQSDLLKYKDAWINEQNDYFTFSSDLEGVAVVVEYMGNQLGDNTDNECEINVPSELEDALEYYVKYKVLEDGQDTFNRSQAYLKLFKARRDKALANYNALTIKDLILISTQRHE